jgi:hypothetical protein
VLPILQCSPQTNTVLVVDVDLPGVSGPVTP